MVTSPSASAGSDLALLDRWWRAANYLSVGQIYLIDNPLLREPLQPAHVSHLLGHWGTTPGLNFVYAHTNRVIQPRDLDVVYVFGPGHGGPAAVANAYLDGTYSEVYPHISRDEDGMRALFRVFVPGRDPVPRRPRDTRLDPRRGRAGYSLSHAYGAAFDNPGLLVCCVIGDGEAETGALATGWHSNKFLVPGQRRGCPPHPSPEWLQDRQSFGAGAHRRPGANVPTSRATAIVCTGSRAMSPRLHEQMAATLDTVLDEIPP